MAFIWPVGGALVGYMAAYYRGFSTTAGIIAGMLLGIFSPLLFLVTTERYSDDA